MKTFYNILLIGFLIMQGSCKKLLDTQPADFLSTTNYYNTEDHLDYALAGVYDILGSSKLYGAQLTALQNTQADEGFYFGVLTSGLEIYKFTENDGALKTFWQFIYIGVSRANTLLANIDKNKNINEDFRNRVRGEALFLRAYYYFLLVQNFENVPLLLSPTMNADEVDIPVTSAKEIYEHIIADMEAAEVLVDPIEKIGFGGRVSKSAVRGILARVYLNMAGKPLMDVTKYERAKYWAKKVIDDNSAAHLLNPDYSDIFIKYAQDKYDIKESIWEVEFWGNSADAFTESGYVGTFLGIRNPYPNNGIGYSFGRIVATGKLYRSYETTDLRRDWNIAPFVYTASGTKSYYPPFPTLAQQYVRSAGKYRREYELVTPKSTQQTPINFPLLRFSDVLLMFAEADNYVSGGPTSEAIGAINKVRRRGYGKHLNGYGQTSESIKTIIITNGGSGYTSIPIIKITGGGGENATATATVSGGVIRTVTITNPGSKFTSLPAITITGNGTGAILTPTLTQITDADLKAGQIASQALFLEAIQEERSRELCFEALRRFDLIRWGILVPTMKGVLNQMNSELPTATYQTASFLNVSDKYVIYPIPLYELELNKKLVQHPLWR